MAARTWTTTPEVAAAAGVAGVTVQDWSKRGVLPPYEIIHGGRRGKTSRWPLHAPAQAKWVKALLDEGHTFEEIRAKLAAGEFSTTQEGNG
ncbi:MerR family transcriptional regulator [Nannocystis pusilla]|uniref:MerR family transcriptional regulator n=1 Tax=Nannocystis pusilla TaxID=889268 RepID=UPI003DA2D4B4